MAPLKKIYVEITNICNLQCPFCPPGFREKGFLAKDRFSRLLERIRGRADSLYFHVKGEPLMHPDLADFIGMSGTAGFDVHITTNGTLLESRAGELADQPTLKRLNVSLHSEGVDKASHDVLMRTVEAAKRLAAGFRASGSGTVISLRLWNDGIEGAGTAVIDVLEAAFGLEEGGIVRGIAGKRGLVLTPGITLHPAPRFEWPASGGKDLGGRGFCRGLRDQAGILLDGTVVPCCLDGEGVVALGNIYEAEWDAVMTSPRARALRDGFSCRRAVEPLCRTCGFRQRFGS